MQVKVEQKSKWILYWVLILLYRASLDLAYITGLVPYYGYYGFLNKSSIVTVIVSVIILILGAGICFKHYVNGKARISSEVILVLFLLTFVPFTSMTAFGVLTPGFILGNTVYWLILLYGPGKMIDLLWRKRFQVTSDRRLVPSEKSIMIVAVLSFAVVVYISWRYSHFRLNFSLSNVYELRAEAKANALPTVLVYLFGWTKALVPLCMSWFIRKKKYFWALMCVAVQLLSFGYDGVKGTLFLLIITVLINLMPNLRYERFNRLMMIGLTLVVAVSVVIVVLTGNLLVLSLAVRRTMYLPVLISTYYFDFFSSHVPDFFYGSFLRHFGLQTLYPNLSVMIGTVYTGSVSGVANNGLVSDAITNMGLAGIVIMPMILVIVLTLCDRNSSGLDGRICIAAAVDIALLLSNSFLLTTLLSHGLLALIVALRLVKRDKPLLDRSLAHAQISRL